MSILDVTSVTVQDLNVQLDFGRAFRVTLTPYEVDELVGYLSKARDAALRLREASR